MRWIFLALLMPSAFAFAEQEAHVVAFTEGRYEDAAHLVEQAPSAGHFAFAARSLLAEAMSDPTYSPPTELVIAAEQKARQALALDADHIEGRLQLAIALSLKVRPMSNREGMRTGYADDAKRLAKAVLQDDPTNAYAHGFMAVWNLEVRRRGGTIGASVMGASVKDARRYYQTATGLAPNDASLHWQYARALAALNAKKYAGEINAALRKAIDSQPRNTLEQVMQSRAQILLAVLETDSRKTVERVAAQML